MVADRIERAPGLRWVLDEDPSVRRPQRRDAGMPDLRHHVRAVRVGADPDDLADVVSAFVEQPLNRSRPLWEALVVRGLADGQWAFVWRLHHSVAGGIASRAVMGHLMDTQPDGGPTLADAAMSGATAGDVRRLRPTDAPAGAHRSSHRRCGHRRGVGDQARAGGRPCGGRRDPPSPGSLTGPLSGRCTGQMSFRYLPRCERSCTERSGRPSGRSWGPLDCRQPTRTGEWSGRCGGLGQRQNLRAREASAGGRVNPKSRLRPRAWARSWGRDGCSLGSRVGTHPRDAQAIWARWSAGGLAGSSTTFSGGTPHR